MSGFGGYVKNHEDEDQEVAIGNWPIIKISEFCIQRRIPSHFDVSSVLTALQAAMLDVVQQVSAGCEIEMDAIHIAIFKRAVFASAHADLLCEFATQDRREAAENGAEDEFRQADRFRAQAKSDIALLRKYSVNTVALL